MRNGSPGRRQQTYGNMTFEDSSGLDYNTGVQNLSMRHGNNNNGGLEMINEVN